VPPPAEITDADLAAVSAWLAQWPDDMASQLIADWGITDDHLAHLAEH
jgi:hypothetical protein